MSGSGFAWLALTSLWAPLRLPAVVANGRFEADDTAVVDANACDPYADAPGANWPATSTPRAKRTTPHCSPRHLLATTLVLS